MFRLWRRQCASFQLLLLLRLAWWATSPDTSVQSESSSIRCSLIGCTIGYWHSIEWKYTVAQRIIKTLANCWLLLVYTYRGRLLVVLRDPVTGRIAVDQPFLPTRRLDRLNGALVAQQVHRIVEFQFGLTRNGLTVRWKQLLYSIHHHDWLEERTLSNTTLKKGIILFFLLLSSGTRWEGSSFEDGQSGPIWTMSLINKRR